MIGVTSDRIISAEQADCSVQVVLESTDKSINANQVFGYFRWDKSTQVKEYHGLSFKEVAKNEQEWKEIGWINPTFDLCNCIHHHIKQAINPKLCVERYAKSSAISANMYTESSAKRTSKQVE